MTHKNPIYYTDEQHEWIVEFKDWDSYITKDKETAINQCMKEHKLNREDILEVKG